VDVERFNRSPVGRILPISYVDVRLNRTVKHWAFIAKPLPSEPRLSSRTYKALSEAERELGRLDAQVQLLPNPTLLVRPALQREAISTSALEGTYAPLTDVLAADHIDDRRKSAELREIQNYTQAALLGLELIDSKPICFSVAAQLQQRLVRQTRGDQFDSGRIRERIVAIGEHSGEIEKARFVPSPPGDELISGISEWEKWLHAEDDIPFVARLALSHYQFETLHPFSDGNGRIGRLLIALQMVEAGVLHYPVLNLSSWLEPRRPEYIDHLLQVSADGDYDRWVAFFATGVRQQAILSARRVARLTVVQEQLVRRVLEANRKGVIVELARELIGSPLLSVKDVQEKYGVSQPSARQIVLNLEQLGLLREVTQASWGRLYVCDEVYHAIASDG
jgi:Fic family protein